MLIQLLWRHHLTHLFCIISTNAAAQGLRADWIVSFPLLTTLLAVTGGIFIGAMAVF
jgi:hypothetical protein